MSEKTWVTWSPKGHDPYTNPKSTVAHAAPAMSASDARRGGFPLACGRWAPDGFDARVEVNVYARRCRRCEKALS